MHTMDDHDNASWLLTRYEQERDELLAQITVILEQDPRVVAAWLFGSLGRGEADPWSDLDVWVVVADGEVETVAARRREEASRVARPLLVVEAPQNAPAGGAYLMACYDAPVAPHQVDWYWQPRSRAAIPAQTCLLFDRVGLPRLAAGTPFGQG